MEVEREKSKPTEKNKRKREKGNDIDTGKAVRSNIKGECGFYMLMFFFKELYSWKNLLFYFIINIYIIYIGFSFVYLFGSDGSINAISGRKMKESSRKKNRKNEERNTLTGKSERPSTDAEVEFVDQYGAFIDF